MVISSEHVGRALPAAGMAALLIALALGHILPAPAVATELNVPSPSYPTIQSAIDAAATDDVITVAEGTYYENINFDGKQITVRSTNPDDPTAVANTIIDGSAAGSTVTFAGTESPQTLLCGVTITNGSAWSAGGIDGSGTLATIANCVIAGNSASGRRDAAGGGVAFCDGLITNCDIIGNSGVYGGGVYHCGGLITSCMIAENSAAKNGGGLSSCTASIDNSNITDNTADDHGGGFSACAGSISRCSITGNVAGSRGGGSYGCGSDMIMRDCVISRNSAHCGGGLADGWARLERCLISENLATEGGALYKFDGPVLACTVTRNTAARFGGAMVYASGTIQDCAIVGNTAGDGGGAMCMCDPEMIRCVIAGNVAGGSGAALYACRGGYLLNCVIASNRSAPETAAISNFELDLINCTIVNNSPSAVRHASSLGGTDQILNCVFRNNGSIQIRRTLGRDLRVDYTCVEGGQDSVAGVIWGVGNVEADPRLIDLDGPDDDPDTWQDNDYHLLPNSPCINGGDPAGDYGGQLDMDGEPRVLYGRVDMGADEVTPIAGDFEPDGDVDLDDYAALEAAMNGPNHPPGDPATDLDADGDCDLGDFIVFAHNFTGLFSDFDDDGDVDLDDYAVFVSAMNGPNQPPGDPAADLDGDNDCDLNDLSIFVLSFTGPL